jgi:opacity protein-like surface antigen
MQLNARLVGAAWAILCLGSVSLTSTTALAADLGHHNNTAEVLDQPHYVQNIGRYLRVDAGLGRYDGPSFSQAEVTANGGTFVQEDIGTQGFVGAGIGWKLSNWLRTDLTGEYRLPGSVHGYDNLTATLITGEQLQANTTYTAQLSAVVGLANVYADLGKWGRFSPYIGAGAGFARVELSHLEAQSYGTLTDPATGASFSRTESAASKNNSEWNFAWALMAGLSVDLNPEAILDVGYRYIDLGGGAAGASDLIVCQCGTVGRPLEVADLTAHEFRIGLRFPLGGHDSEPVQPLK